MEKKTDRVDFPLKEREESSKTKSGYLLVRALHLTRIGRRGTTGSGK